MQNIRRKDRAIEETEAFDLLNKGEYGILSTVDQSGQPYAVPLNYAFKDNCIYFHSAQHGHKIDNIENNPKVSFCVVGKTNVLPSRFTSEFESVVVFGVASVVHGPEKHKALLWLLEKYCPEFIEKGKQFIADKATKVIKVEIEHITGKRAKIST